MDGLEGAVKAKNFQGDSQIWGLNQAEGLNTHS